MHHGVEIPEGKGSGCRAVGLSSSAAEISGVLGGSGELRLITKMAGATIWLEGVTNVCLLSPPDLQVKMMGV